MMTLSLALVTALVGSVSPVAQAEAAASARGVARSLDTLPLVISVGHEVKVRDEAGE